MIHSASDGHSEGSDRGFDDSGADQAGARPGEGARSTALRHEGDHPGQPDADESDRLSATSHGAVGAPLTVITPTIPGREGQLGYCVESVEEQTIPVKHLVGLDLDREGPAVIRNRLVEKADTPWVLFLDDDDVIDPDYVETVLPHFETSDLVYTWCRKNFEYPTDLPFDGPALRQRNVIPVTVCLRVDAFRAAGGFSSDVAHEDWSLWLKLLDIGARFTCVPEHKWEYRRSDDGRNAENNRKLAQGKLREV
jgi:glycosyltransferase involved in cell wall biosynthesis